MTIVIKIAKKVINFAVNTPPEIEKITDKPAIFSIHY